ncbi:MAG: hypothetical protein LUH15_08670 [Tannerellaceae bacterium]|nr:hypothetical protein [Tannerellaceae bacterium]
MQHFDEIEVCRVKTGEDNLYDIYLEVKENTDKTTLKEKVYNLYHRYRNLCENIGHIRFEVLCREEKREPRRVKPVNWSLLNRSAIPIPRLPEQYTSVIEHFPTCYGLQDQRKEAAQLTGYLLIYDLLLAHVTEEVRELQNLMRINGMKQLPAWPSYPYQPVDKWIDREKGVHRTTGIHNNAINRKNYF